MKFSILVLLLLSLQNALAGFFPVAARYEGAGGAYGIGYATDVGGYNILLGGAGGDINAYGLMVSKYFTDDWQLSLGGAAFNDVVLTTTYLRGMQDDTNDLYFQELDGHAYGLNSKLWLFDDYVTFNMRAVQSTIQLGTFYDEEGTEVELPGANLFDITTTNARVGFDFNFFDDARSPDYGMKVTTGISQLSGRKGQSDHMIVDYGVMGLIPMLDHFSWLLKANFTDAMVDKPIDKYDTEAEIRAALGVDCSSLDAAGQARCQKLEAQLVQYILANNTLGTTNPLGGSGGLRSFREMRFRSRHNALYVVELHSNLSTLFDVLNTDEQQLAMVLFFDTGYASDDKLTMFDTSSESSGLALKYTRGAGSINLQVATGSDDSSAWSLGFGSAF